MVLKMIKINKNKNNHFLLVNCNDYSTGSRVILSIQCIECIKKTYPDSKVSFLLHSSMSGFLENNPYLDNIFCIDNKDIINELKAAKINISISLIADKKSTILLFKTGIKTRIGVFSNFFSLLFNYKIKQKRLDSNKHEILHNIALLKPINCKDICYPKIFLSISQKNASSSYLESKFKDNAKDLIIISPSTKGNGWSLKNFLSLANSLCNDFNVLIVGQKEEINLYKSILEHFENLSEKNLFLYDENIESKNLTYTQMLLSTISHANVIISNYNTLLYAAYAMGVQTFSIMPFNSNINPIRFAPLGKNDIILTPLGIYNRKSPAEIDNENGVRLDNITQDLVLDILDSKILKQ